MLVIRRRAGEAVLIGDDVEITIVDVSATRVKIGITAPSTVLILRKEIQLAASQNIAASEGVSPASVGLLVDTLRRKQQVPP